MSQELVSRQYAATRLAGSSIGLAVGGPEVRAIESLDRLPAAGGPVGSGRSPADQGFETTRISTMAARSVQRSIGGRRRVRATGANVPLGVPSPSMPPMAPCESALAEIRP